MLFNDLLTYSEGDATSVENQQFQANDLSMQDDRDSEKLQQLGKFRFADQASGCSTPCGRRRRTRTPRSCGTSSRCSWSLKLRTIRRAGASTRWGAPGFFERMDRHQTMEEMRAHLRKVGVESFKWISMIHFLIFNYG